MRDSPVVKVIAGLVIAGAVGTMVFCSTGWPPRVEARTPEAVGWVMAQQTLGLVKPGGQITVLARDTSSFKNPASEIQLASFKKAMRAARVEITSVRSLQVDPLRPVEVPPGDFLDLIRAAPAGSVLVSFMGPPLLSESQRNQLREIKPSMVAFCSGNLPGRMDLRALFEQGLLHAAVVSRRHRAAASSRPADRQAWFDQSFLAITAANIAELERDGKAP